MLDHPIIPEERCRPRSFGCGARAFSLIELLIVISIITILGTLLLTAVRGVREEARSLHCASSMRNLAMKFEAFALRENPEGRGDSEQLGGNRFRINDFQDLLYGIDEFWDQDDRQTGTLTPQQSLMLCPSARSELTKRAGFPCGQQSLQPLDSVSVALNMRLYRGVIELSGRSALAPTALTFLRESVIDHPYTPLAMDVDAEAAISANHDPFYISPAIDGVDDPYASNRFWFPSDRHRGTTMVAFIGGHVQRSKSPATEGWSWRYSAQVGR
jgi:prepilin-type N-terminal cleavage/methylation domain-containing protein/prepilin-type processing-associated H-X9-DG protein